MVKLLQIMQPIKFPPAIETRIGPPVSHASSNPIANGIAVGLEILHQPHHLLYQHFEVLP